VLGGSGANQYLAGDNGNHTVCARFGEDQFIDGGAGNDVILVGTTIVSDIMAQFDSLMAAPAMM
jgi:Ca2+-binding RTX toxin-like protein